MGFAKACLCYRSDKPMLVGYTDANMASDLDIRKSTLVGCHGNQGCKSILLCPLLRPNLSIQPKLVRRCYGSRGS